MSALANLDRGGAPPLARDHAGLPRGAPAGQGKALRGRSPRVVEIVAVMRQAGVSIYGDRLRGTIVVLWRAGLRIHEALALAETDLDERRDHGIRHGKGDKRREVGMDDWAWDPLRS